MNSVDPCCAAIRPVNAPICLPVLRDPPVVFVTLRGGGLLVLNYTATPLQILTEYDNKTIGANGCGGVSAGKYM
jgi:hypothetical protein